MARIEIVMPQMGESITNGTITRWNKSVGDAIELDEILFEISTDKVESEIPSPVEGKLVEILFPEGETVDVGIPVAVVDDDMNAEVVATSQAPAEKPSQAPVVPEIPVSNEEGSNDRRFYTPLVKKMAEEAGVPLCELSKVQGSGAGGRVNKQDLENFITNNGPVKSSQPPKSESVSTSSKAPSLPTGGVAQVRGAGERVEIIPMDNMRKAIAKNMVSSKLTSPHVSSISEVDVTHIVQYREKIKHDFKKREGVNLTYTHFFLWAITQALKEYPLVNASIEGDNIVVKKDINLGCAVAVPGNGLVVPVIRNIDTLNMVGIVRALDSLVQKARTRKLTMEELTGGTFTFTNVGSFGTLMATPVILQPQVGILAGGAIQKRVVVTKDNSIAIRDMLYLTHTYDHRLVDGELGGLFLEYICQKLRDLDPSSIVS
ncbi:MAG: 2-oxo acid dehydrogenase subunit E2 [Halobacteriovoraceae bacterium]|nr:2-oxo acid dehydrogenase subunit E2 [Halobacteriovoraceae bacterium]